MKILAVAFRKGGVGKSTLAVHLAFHLAAQGKRVLLVDTDEGDLSEVFPALDNDEHLVASKLLMGQVNCAPRLVSQNIWLAPADVEVIDVDDLPMDEMPDLRGNLQTHFAGDFDVVIIDTPPNLQRRFISALAAADGVVAPFSISSFSFHRLPKFLAAVENIKTALNPSLKLLGLVPFLVNSKSASEVEVLPYVQDKYGSLLINTPVMTRACVPTSLAESRPVWKNARSGNQRQAAKEMRAACREVVRRLYA